MVDNLLNLTSSGAISSSSKASLVTHDLGGSGDLAICAHGAGLCGSMFEPLANALSPAMHLHGLDLRGHGWSDRPNPINYEWPAIAEDLLRVVQSFDANHIIGIGHSLGGTAMLLAEATQPGTFDWIYCYEPPFVAIEERQSERFSERINATRRRRSTFASREQALDHYRDRGVLAQCTEEALRAYIRDGFRDLPDGSIELVLSPDDEATIYALAPPAHLIDLQAVTCPVVVAYGSESRDGGRQFAERAVSRLSRSQLDVVEGAQHLGPMGLPDLVAQSIRRSSEWATS